MFISLYKRLRLESLGVFRPSHMRPWAKVAYSLIGFSMFAVSFSIAFALIEHASLGGGSFLHNFGNSIYYFFTSISTVGYGDITPKTALGKLLFIFCISIYGVYKLVNTVDLVVQVRQHKTMLKRKGRLFMQYKNHLICFFDVRCLCKYNFLFIDRFVNENLNSNKFMNSKILFVNSCIDTELNTAFSLFLQESDFYDGRVILINADIYEKGLFDKIHLKDAKHIYVFGENDSGLASDSKVIDTVLRIRHYGYASNNISAELIDDEIRYVLQNANVETIIRPTRSYPELFVRATVAEGSEKMLEELLGCQGDSIATFKLNPKTFVWGELMYRLSIEGVGTIIAYIKTDGAVIPNPKGTDTISDMDRLIIIVNNFETKDFYELEKTINEYLSALE